MNLPQNWNVETMGPLDLEAVKARHQPDFKFRVQQRRARPHTPFISTSAVPQSIYVISGSLNIARERAEDGLALHAHQFMDLPPGLWWMSYPEEVDFILALELPSKVLRMA
jgi:hypothetical protein